MTHDKKQKIIRISVYALFVFWWLRLLLPYCFDWIPDIVRYFRYRDDQTVSAKLVPQAWGTLTDESQLSNFNDFNRSCAGLFVTPGGNWMIGTDQGTSENYPYLKDTQNFDHLLPHKPTTAKKDGQDQNDASEPSATEDSYEARNHPFVVLSRQDKDGKFIPVMVNRLRYDCFMLSPDGKRVYLAMSDDKKSDLNAPDLIYSSDDQGQHWQLNEHGFFRRTSSKISTRRLKIYSYDGKSMWAVHEDLNSYKYDLDHYDNDKFTPSCPQPLGLYHSGDGGDTVSELCYSQPLLVSLEEIQKRVPGDFEWGDGNQKYGDVKGYVIQFDDNAGVVWFSQTFHYEKNRSNGYYDSQAYITTRATLTRRDGQWQVSNPVQLANTKIADLRSNSNGQSIAILDDGLDLKAGLLNHQTLDWDIQGTVPHGFSPLQSTETLQSLHVGNNSMVIGVASEYELPVSSPDSIHHRWLSYLMPWRNSSSSYGLLFSTDWGHTWHVLPSDKCKGIVGMDAKNNRAICSNGEKKLFGIVLN